VVFQPDGDVDLHCGANCGRETEAARLLLAVDHPYREELDAPMHPWGPGPVRRTVEAVEAYPRHSFTVANSPTSVA